MDPFWLLRRAGELGVTITFSTADDMITVDPNVGGIAGHIRRWRQEAEAGDPTNWRDLVGRLKGADGGGPPAVGDANRRLSNPSAFGDPSRWR